VATCLTYKSSSQQITINPVNLIGGYALHLQKLFTSNQPTNQQISEPYWWLRASPTKALHIKPSKTTVIIVVANSAAHNKRYYYNK
jgi:hypothetical protein